MKGEIVSASEVQIDGEADLNMETENLMIGQLGKLKGDIKTINAQKYLSDLQGVNNSYFCGSYFGYGFHEDGLNSGINVSNKL